MLRFGWMRGWKDLGVGSETFSFPQMEEKSLWLVSKEEAE